MLSAGYGLGGVALCCGQGRIQRGSAMLWAG